ncbi:MAG: DUF1254 domain-containing protein [Thermoguttaceae bacterium]
MSKSMRIVGGAVVAGLVLALLSVENRASAKETSEEDPGVEAYVYGFPLVLMEVSKRVMTHVPSPTPSKAPINQFAHMQAFPTPDFKDVVSPNADTLYSSAWLDLSREPIVLHVPDTQGRYYLMPMLDGWTNVFASPGKRTTGTKAGDFAIVGPGWQGTLPAGVREIKAPTTMVWLLGRTQTNGASDFAAVHAIQRQYTLTPLSAFGNRYSPLPAVPVDPNVDDKTPPVEQVAKMDAATFFGMLADLMVANPPAAADAPMLAKLKQIGVVPGQKPDPVQMKSLDAAVKVAQAKMAEAARNPGPLENGWVVRRDLGDYGTDYGKRAVVALIGLGANLSADAIYPYTEVDDEGRPLNGSRRYVIHFAKGQTPPVEAFWSVTMYDSHHFFVANPINRYAIGDRDALRFNPDGSLDLFLQHQSPGKEKESNWLPAPAGNFNLIMRMYWPKPEVLNGTYKIPAVEPVR